MHNLISINVYIPYIFMLRISYSIIFSIFIDCTGVNPMDEEMCLVDNGTANTILREIKYFQTLTMSKENGLTTARRDAVIAGSRRAIITLPMGTTITIKDALLYPDSTRILLSYRDIHKKGYHIETHHQNNEEFLLIRKDNEYGRDTLERIPSTLSRLYYSNIKPVQHVAYKVIFQNVNAFHTWHDCLGHP